MRKLTLLGLIAVLPHGAEQYPPDAEQKRQMQEKMSALSARVSALAAKHADAALLADGRKNVGVLVKLNASARN